MTALLVPERKQLWRPGDPIPEKPYIAPNGNVTVVRPLNLIEEIELVLRQERAKRDGYELVEGAAAPTAWSMTNTGRTSILDGTFDVDTDTHKMALFLSASDLGLTSTTFAAVTSEHAAANGYTAGGIAITLTLAGTTTVTIDITTDPVWTAAGGSIIARFAAIYEVAGNIMFFCTLDSTPADVTATDTNTLTVAANASGVSTLA